MPTNVPPSNKAEATIPGRVDQRTLAATPAASSAQARAKAFALPILSAQNPQNAIEGAAASPTRSQTKGSEPRTSSDARTIATRKVAVITEPKPKSPYAKTRLRS